MRLKGLDLNLLVALDILLEERSVSRAAERLHLSQPAASAALGRLRIFFHDELLVLHGKRLIPTSYAESLMPEVKRIISQVDTMISMSTDFDPLLSERQFRLMSSDYILNVLLHPVIISMQLKAPKVTFDIRLSGDDGGAEFERGKIDLVIVPEEYLNTHHPFEPLFEERHVVVGWEGNALLNKKLTKDAFLSAGHIDVSLGSTGGHTFTGTRMEKLGYQRRVEIYAPHFSAIPWLLQGTNRLAVLQERLARKFAKVLPLKIAPLPFEFPKMRMMAQYHTAKTSDQGLKWLRQCLKASAAESDT